MNIVKTEISYILEARISGFNRKKISHITLSNLHTVYV